MCIAHHFACKCEQVCLPTLGSQDAWYVMRNRFKIVHGIPAVVDTCKVPPIPKPRLSTPAKHVKWVIGYTTRVNREVEKPTPVRKQRKVVHSMPTPPMYEQRNALPRIPTPAHAMKRHTSNRLPVTRSASCDVYSPFNRIHADPLFLPKSIKTRGTCLPHARH